MMGTRAAAFAGKIFNLRESLLRIQNGTMPQPTCIDIANMLKYFCQVLHDFRDFKDIENIPLYANEKRDQSHLIKTLPSFDYCGLYKTLAQLVDILPLIPHTSNGYEQLGTNLLMLFKCLVPFLDQANMETMPYLVTTLFMSLPQTFHKDILDTLCFNLLPFTIDQQRKNTVTSIKKGYNNQDQNKQQAVCNSDINNGSQTLTTNNTLEPSSATKQQQPVHCIVRIENPLNGDGDNTAERRGYSKGSIHQNDDRGVGLMKDEENVTKRDQDQHQSSSNSVHINDQEQEQEYALLSVTSILMVSFHYIQEPMHHSQLVESLMKLKNNVFEDLLFVIAYGTTRARCPATEILFRYWPDICPSQQDRKNSSQMSKLKHVPWKPTKCQNKNCSFTTLEDDEAVKMCLDFKISISLSELPPPMLVCLDCVDSIYKQQLTSNLIGGNGEHSMSNLSATNLNQQPSNFCRESFQAIEDYSSKFIDLLLPMERVSKLCENKRCKSTDRVAIGTCFDIECANYNGKKPIRYCRTCFIQNHEPCETNKYDLTLQNHIRHSIKLTVWDNEENINNFVEAIISLLKEAAPAEKAAKDSERHLRSLIGPISQLTSDTKDGINMATEERQLISQYGIWLMTGLCKSVDKLSDELLGRLLGMLFQWFHFTACLPDDQAGSALEKLKGECIKGWIMDVKNKRLDVFISCLLPHPIDCSKIGGHWEVWPDTAHQIKEGFKRLLCLVPYDIITDDVWDEIMPYWMECFRHEVPENELNELKILLSKVFDPELSPLGFETKQMYNFISSRFEDSSNTDQEQTLYWLQIITMLEIPIPIEFLFQMLRSCVKSLSEIRTQELHRLRMAANLSRLDDELMMRQKLHHRHRHRHGDKKHGYRHRRRRHHKHGHRHQRNSRGRASQIARSSTPKHPDRQVGRANSLSSSSSLSSCSSDSFVASTSPNDSSATSSTSSSPVGGRRNCSPNKTSSSSSSLASARNMSVTEDDVMLPASGPASKLQQHQQQQAPSDTMRQQSLSQQERQAEARAAFSAKLMHHATLLEAQHLQQQNQPTSSLAQKAFASANPMVSSASATVLVAGGHHGLGKGVSCQVGPTVATAASGALTVQCGSAAQLNPPAPPPPSKSQTTSSLATMTTGRPTSSSHSQPLKSTASSSSGAAHLSGSASQVKTDPASLLKDEKRAIRRQQRRQLKNNKKDDVNDKSMKTNTDNQQQELQGSTRPKLRLNLDSMDAANELANVSKIDNNLVCYILMMDILLKQLDLQEINSHRGLDGKEAQQAIDLLNSIISTPWLGRHTCCDIVPYMAPNDSPSMQPGAAMVSSSSGAGVNSGALGSASSSSLQHQSNPKTPTTATTSGPSTASQQQHQQIYYYQQQSFPISFHSFGHCAQGFEHEDTFETCVFCEIISTFHQLAMSLIEFFSPLIEVSIYEVSQDAANGEFNGEPDYSRIGVDHLDFNGTTTTIASKPTNETSQQNQFLQSYEPKTTPTIVETPPPQTGQNQQQYMPITNARLFNFNQEHSSSLHKLPYQQDPISPFSPSYLGPTLRPEVLEGLPKELQMAYNLLVQFHQYQAPDIVSQLLQMIKLISLHSQVLSKASKQNPQFITWCQHNMLINKLWSLCQLESSEIARTCVPLLMHCITLPWGVRLFRDLVERDFNSENWLSRFRAVERVVTIAYFCEPSTIKNSTLLQSTMANAFCFVVRCLDDIEAIVAQRALVSLEMMKTSSLKLLLWCLEVQFDYIIADRPMILRSVFQLYNHLRDRRFLTWEFFLNRFDTIFMEAQIYLQQTGEIPSFTMQDLKNTNTKSEIYQKKILRAKEALQETHHSRSLSSRFQEQRFTTKTATTSTAGKKDDPNEINESMQQYKQSIKLQQKLQQAPRGALGSKSLSASSPTMTLGLSSADQSAHANARISVTTTDLQEPTATATTTTTTTTNDRRRPNNVSPMRRILQHGKSTSSRYQSVAYLTSQSLARRKNSKFMTNLAMQSVPPLMLPDKLHQHLPNSFVDDGSKLNEIAQENHVFGVVHRVCDEDRDTNHSLVFLLMQFFSKPDPSHPQSFKTLNRNHQIVLRHLNILMGYSIARKNFLIPASNLRLLPVFNAFLTSLPKVLDFNYTLGTILLDTCLPILIYCPAPDNVQYDSNRIPSYSLWLLNPLMRQSWLMSVLAFLYKHQFAQVQLKEYVYKLMWIVINTLESHLTCSANFETITATNSGSFASSMPVSIQTLSHDKRHQVASVSSSAGQHYQHGGGDQVSIGEVTNSTDQQQAKTCASHGSPASKSSQPPSSGKMAPSQQQQQQKQQQHPIEAIEMSEVRPTSHIERTGIVSSASSGLLRQPSVSTGGDKGPSSDARPQIYKAETSDSLQVKTKLSLNQQQLDIGLSKRQFEPQPTTLDGKGGPSSGATAIARDQPATGGTDTFKVNQQQEERLLPIGLPSGPRCLAPRAPRDQSSSSVERLLPIGPAASPSTATPTLVVHERAKSSQRQSNSRAPFAVRQQSDLGSGGNKVTELDAKAFLAGGSSRPLQGLRGNLALIQSPSSVVNHGNVVSSVSSASLGTGTNSVNDEQLQQPKQQQQSSFSHQLEGGKTSADATQSGVKIPPRKTDGSNNRSETVVSASTSSLTSVASASHAKLPKTGNGSGCGRIGKQIESLDDTITQQQQQSIVKPYSTLTGGRKGAKSQNKFQMGSSSGAMVGKLSDHVPTTATKFQQQRNYSSGGLPTSSSSPSLLNEQLAQLNRHSFVQEFADKDLSMCLVILETFIHHEPSMAAQFLPNILRLVARYSSASSTATIASSTTSSGSPCVNMASGTLDCGLQTGNNVHLVGGSMFVARQFIRVALHDLMENNIFHQIFTSHFTGYEFYKNMSTALADFSDLNQLAPLSKLFEDLNKQKNLPQVTSLMTILENVATYFECVISESSSHSQTTWNSFILNWENFLRKLILALPRYSGIALGTAGNAAAVAAATAAATNPSHVTAIGGASNQVASTGTLATATSSNQQQQQQLQQQQQQQSIVSNSSVAAGSLAANQMSPGTSTSASNAFLLARSGGSGGPAAVAAAAAVASDNSSGAASGNSSGAIPSSCSMIMAPIMRIILCTTKISYLASCKTIVDPYSKIISYTVLNSQFKYEHLLEINHNCCRLYTRDREKYLIQRTIAYELVQVLKFRFFILEENLLILLLFVLQDVGGLLPPKVISNNLKIDRATLNQANSFITNVSECLRQHIGDLLEFITDVHAISRINDNLIGSRPSSINRDSFGGHVKASISQYLALEISLTNADNRTILRYLPWLYSSPSLQQGPREFIDCVSHIRQLSWIILGSLQHSALMRDYHSGGHSNGLLSYSSNLGGSISHPNGACGANNASSSSSAAATSGQNNHHPPGSASISSAVGGSGNTGTGLGAGTGAMGGPSVGPNATGGSIVNASSSQQQQQQQQQHHQHQHQHQQQQQQQQLQLQLQLQQQQQQQQQQLSSSLSSSSCGGGIVNIGSSTGCNSSASSPINCQPIPIDKNNNVAEHVQVILAGFAEQSKESVLHMSGLFHAFLLCQLWTMYCENICSQHPAQSEQYRFCQSTLDDFWSKITPGVLRLVGHSRVMSEMVSTHFLQLIESLIESNSSILIKYLPLWNSVFYSYKKRNKSGNLAIRLQKCIEWQPPDLHEQDGELNKRRFINWLEKVQYKMSHIEIQSSQAAPFYLS